MRINNNEDIKENNKNKKNRSIKVYSRNFKYNNSNIINEYNKISSGTLTESFPEINNEESITIKRLLADHDNKFKYTFKNYQTKHKKNITLFNLLTFKKNVSYYNLNLRNKNSNIFSNKIINSHLDNYQKLSITNNVIKFKNMKENKKILLNDLDLLKEIKNKSTSNFNNKYNINFFNENKLKRDYISNLINKYKKGQTIENLTNEIKNRKFKLYISNYNYIPEEKINNIIHLNENNLINNLYSNEIINNNNNKVRINSLKITRPLSYVIHDNKISYVCL